VGVGLEVYEQHTMRWERIAWKGGFAKNIGIASAYVAELWSAVAELGLKAGESRYVFFLNDELKLHKLLILINHNNISNDIKSSKIRLLAYTFIRNIKTINTKIHRPLILNRRFFYKINSI
jgi:hypothetical protein